VVPKKRPSRSTARAEKAPARHHSAAVAGGLAAKLRQISGIRLASFVGRADAVSNERERLVEEWDRYHELFSWAPLGYARLTHGGLVSELNHAGADLLEVTPDRVIGQPFVAFVAKPDRATFARHLAQARTSSDTVESEIELQSAGGHRFPVRMCTRRSPPSAPGMCWTIFDDLSERRRMAARPRRARPAHSETGDQHRLARLDSEAKDRFVAALSHELRTPLTPVLMAASMLSSLDGLPARARSIIETIRRNVEREARLIDNLLDATLLSRHTMAFDRQDVDVHALLRDAVSSTFPDAQAKGLEIRLHAAARLARTSADPARLLQAFQHLLGNAVKFTSSGRIEVTTENDAPNMIRIAISDTGVGIAADVLPRLFVPLEPRAALGSDMGLGLGLTLCRGIIQAHQGHIVAMSPGPGQGSTFEIHLPLVAAGADQGDTRSPGEETDPRTAQDQPSPLRILVVEDHMDSGAMLELLLASRGHLVAVADSVAAALARRHEGWDAVISDLGLPDGSGLDVGRGMRDLARRPRLIALSGYGRPADVAASREAGFDVHLVKPLEPDRLFEILER
jgi:PAS domain S-box-containing protein